MEQDHQQEIQLLKKLIHTLESQNASRNQQRAVLNSSIERLLSQNSALYRQIQSLKSSFECHQVDEPADPQLLSVIQTQSAELQRLQLESQRLAEQNNRLCNERTEREAKHQMEKTLLQREMEVLKKLAVQSDQMAKRNEVLEEAVRGREARIHQLEQQVLDKTQQIDQFRDDLQDFRHKTETLADELQRAREDDVHGQLGKYEKELQLSRKAYEEIKNASSIRIDLLEHKLAVANNELQKHIEQKSHGFAERQQLGRNISQLRQVNQNLTAQLQNLNKQYDDLLKLSEQSQSSFANPKQTQQIETLRAQLSSLIAINYTLSTELNAARQGNRMRHKSEIDSSRGGTERYKGELTVRDQSPIYDRSHRYPSGVDQSKASRVKDRNFQRNYDSRHDDQFEKEFRRLRGQLNSIKHQNERINYRNREITETSEYISKNKKNSSFYQPSNRPQTPTAALFDSGVRQRHTSKDFTIKPIQRLTKLVIEDEESRGSRHASNKSKLLALQRKLNDLKIDGQLPKVSPRIRNNL